MDLQQLSSYLKTTSDATSLQRTLEQLAEGLYRTDKSIEESLRKALPYEQAIVINKIASANGVSMDDKAKVQSFFIKLREAVLALPVVQITLAVPPNGNLVTLIHDWFYRTFRKLVILDVIVKPDIVAGCIISCNGKYYDYSLNKQTQQFFAKTR